MAHFVGKATRLTLQGRSGQQCIISPHRRSVARIKWTGGSPTRKPTCLDRHVGLNDNTTLSRIHVQRSSRNRVDAYPSPSMSLPHDILHALHRPKRRASKDSTQDHSPGRDATPASTKEPHGVYQPQQNSLLPLDPKYHPRRSRSDRRKQHLLPTFTLEPTSIF